MRLLLAARLSVKAQEGHGIGLDTQDAQTRDAALRDKHTIVAVTRDQISGTRPLWERPKLREWITDPDKLSRYDGFIVYRLDRLTRGDDATVSEIKAWAHQHGKCILTEDGLRFPSEGNDGIRWDISCRMAHDEWLKIRERSMRAQRELRERNKLVGRPPWGYESVGEKYSRTLVPTPEGKRLVPEVFTRVIKGQSLAQIATWLEAETGRPWWPRTIGHMIRTRTYMGRRQDEHGKVILRCEALVDEPTWRQAGEALDHRPHRGHIDPANRAMLSGAIFCPHCEDSPMYAITSGGKDRHRYYRCAGRGRQRKGCGLMVRTEVVDSAVNQIAADTFDKPVIITKVIPGHDHEAELGEVRLDMQELPTRGLSDAEFDAELARLRAERDRLSGLPNVPTEIKRVPSDQTYAQLWSEMPDAERGAWLKARGFRITADKERVTLVGPLGGDGMDVGISLRLSRLTVHDKQRTLDPQSPESRFRQGARMGDNPAEANPG